MTSRPLSRSSLFRHPGWLVAVAFALSCIGDAAGPGASRPALLQLTPYFQQAPPRGIVRVDRIRVVLVRLRANTPALDTTVQVTPGDSIVDLKLTVPVFTAADTFEASLDMLNPQGAVVFHGGPITVVAIPNQRTDSPPTAIPVEIRYVGVGADAASVEITTAVVPSVLTGDTAIITAVAKNAEGAVIAGTPIGWTSLDTGIARVPDVTQGRAVGRLQRGSARVVAQLVTGPADTVLVPVKLLPATLGIVGGAGQSAVVRSLLPTTVVARAVASDEVPVSGVWIKFQVTAGGGTLSRDSGLTDATGAAGVDWTLGPLVGAQTLRFTTPKVPALQATATATGLAGTGPATTFAITGLPGSIVAGANQAITVTAKDAGGNTVATYAGTVGFMSNDPLATLPGTYTFVSGDNGVHVFPGVTLRTAGTRTVTATDQAVGSLTGTGTTTVSPGTAVRLVFTVQPSDVVEGGTITPPVVVSALDAFDNVATGFNGLVTLSLGAQPCGPATGGTDPAVTASQGVAVFSNLDVDGIPVCNGYTVTASASGLTAATSSTFNVLAPAGTVAWKAPVSGNWNVPTNWVGDAVPGPTNVAAITATGTYTVTLDVSPNVAGLIIGGSSGIQTLSATSRTLTLNGASTIGVNGILDLSASTVGGSGLLNNEGTVAVRAAPWRWTGPS